jgi:hypothetical protein
LKFKGAYVRDAADRHRMLVEIANIPQVDAAVDRRAGRPQVKVLDSQVEEHWVGDHLSGA